MKRLLILAALFLTASAGAQTTAPHKFVKETLVYAVKGSDTLRLDRYVPLSPDSGKKPCLMFLFGGGFFTGGRDQEHYVPYLEHYAGQGYIVVSIDYRRKLKEAVERQTITTENFAPALIDAIAAATEDLYDATAYVCAHMPDVDPARIVTSGSSAGAITVLTGEYRICNGDPLTRRLPEGFRYAGVIAFAGAIFDECDELEWGGVPAPILLFHGDGDRNVPYGAVRHDGAGFFGSEYIARQLTAQHVPHWFYAVSNADHSIAGSPMFDNRGEIDTFLEKLVFGRQPLVLDTQVSRLDAPELPKEFVLTDYIRANFIR